MGDVLARMCVLCLVILLLIALLRRWGQPYLVAYMLAGLVLGPGMAGVFEPGAGLAALGELGILLLMFFLGLEIEIPDRGTLLRRPVVAQAVKMGLAVGCAWAAGAWLSWPWENRVLLAVLLTFNSTAVVSEYMRRTGELETETGRMVLNMLLLQDVLVAPVFAFFPMDGTVDRAVGNAGGIGGGGGGVVCVAQGDPETGDIWSWSGWRVLEGDHDLQVFVGALCCLGCAWLSALVGLSAPIGSFGAGLWLGRARGFGWLGTVLKPFKVFFVALYFVSVGLMLDLGYIGLHWASILGITASMLAMNSLLSALVFRLLGMRWPESFLAGALLSQTGGTGVAGLFDGVGVRG